MCVYALVFEQTNARPNANSNALWPVCVWWRSHRLSVASSTESSFQVLGHDRPGRHGRTQNLSSSVVNGDFAADWLAGCCVVVVLLLLMLFSRPLAVRQNCTIGPCKRDAAELRRRLSQPTDWMVAIILVEPLLFPQGVDVIVVLVVSLLFMALAKSPFSYYNCSRLVE